MNQPAKSLIIAVAQLNPTVGDVAGNADRARRVATIITGAISRDTIERTYLTRHVWSATQRRRIQAEARESERNAADRPCFAQAIPEGH